MIVPLFSLSIAPRPLSADKTRTIPFESGQRTRDGIGKYYLGRELLK